MKFSACPASLAPRLARFSIAISAAWMCANPAFAQKKPAPAAVAEPLAAASAEQLALAERVQTGRIRCELGATVAVLADDKAPGYFIVTTAGKERYRMLPAATTTGAIRLEDKRAGGVWLQLANKSMLLDEKNGRRLADECATDAQRAVAESFKTNPPPPVIDTPAGATPSPRPQ